MKELDLTQSVTHLSLGMTTLLQILPDQRVKNAQFDAVFNFKQWIRFSDGDEAIKLRLSIKNAIINMKIFRNYRRKLARKKFLALTV